MVKSCIVIKLGVLYSVAKMYVSTFRISTKFKHVLYLLGFVVVMSLCIRNVKCYEKCYKPIFLSHTKKN